MARYIIREHIAPFFLAFFTITFLLIIDFVPRIIDRVIDKDLELLVVLELLVLNLAWMLALSIPMSVLVATLMAFGRLSSDYEIVAVKASGIHLLNILIPLVLAASVLSFGMIQFNDKILPDLNKRARTLLGDIQAMRPTLVFQSGIFITDIPGYLVLIDKIDHTTSYVEGVRIAETKDPARPRLITARDGYLKMTDNGQNMQFTLYTGELHTFDLNDPDNYRKLDFQQQVINISGTGSELVRSDSEYRTDREMGISAMEDNVGRADGMAVPLRGKIKTYLQDSFDRLYGETYSNALPDTASDSTAVQIVKVEALNMVRHVERNKQQIEAQKRIMDKYNLEIHKKYSIPAACIVFVMVGAPLGIMTRRGGMGVAIAISISLFIVYWAFLIGGEDVADRGIVSPFWAMWTANFLVGGLGLYLNYIVITEKPLLGFFRGVR
ncbi:MAG: LptF/LptG family permease [candidate division Zixibacteria bacterium]|nr:LptF/LptG family permease [candidate division Zixibacteria bacterium]